MDALQSFSYLVDSIPQWLSNLDRLRLQCETQYEKFSRLTQHGEVRLTRQKKKASTESIQPLKEVDCRPSTAQNSGAPPSAPKGRAAIPGPEAKPNQLPQTAFTQGISRKRRAGSELSAAPSHQNRYRTRHMVVVYYDSEVQNAFEVMVKSIASARNNLRKGRNAVTVQLRMATINSQISQLDKSSDRMEGLALNGTTMVGSALSRMRSTPEAYSGDLKCFDDADRDLEQAQNLCERAAHQFLRDGDCFSEIESTRSRILSCASIARSQVDKLKQEALKAQVEEKEEREAEERTLVGDVTPPSDQVDSKGSHRNISPQTKPPILKELTFSGAGAIEIDDGSDAESVQIDMDAIRRTIRTTRS